MIWEEPDTRQQIEVPKSLMRFSYMELNLVKISRGAGRAWCNVKKSLLPLSIIIVNGKSRHTDVRGYVIVTFVTIVITITLIL